MKAKWILKAVLGFIAFVALAGTVVMMLWNNLMPDIFHLPEITYWQALGLLVLSKIFFKGGSGWMMGGRMKQHWKNKMENMSPEERERYRALWEKRCSNWGKEC
jgi:hypothetical protein